MWYINWISKKPFSNAIESSLILIPTVLCLVKKSWNKWPLKKISQELVERMKAYTAYVFLQPWEGFLSPQLSGLMITLCLCLYIQGLRSGIWTYVFAQALNWYLNYKLYWVQSPPFMKMEVGWMPNPVININCDAIFRPRSSYGERVCEFGYSVQFLHKEKSRFFFLWITGDGILYINNHLFQSFL